MFSALFHQSRYLAWHYSCKPKKGKILLAFIEANQSNNI